MTGPSTLQLPLKNDRARERVDHIHLSYSFDRTRFAYDAIHPSDENWIYIFVCDAKTSCWCLVAHVDIFCAHQLRGWACPDNLHCATCLLDDYQRHPLLNLSSRYVFAIGKKLLIGCAVSLQPLCSWWVISGSSMATGHHFSNNESPDSRLPLHTR